MPSPSQYVTLASDTGLRVTALLDQQSAALTGGFGGWSVVQRPKRVSITRYAGKDPYTLDIPLVFDGTVAPQTSQEILISNLLRMGEQPTSLTQPPAITVRGPIPRRDLRWVINGFNWDAQNVLWVNQGGVPVRIRQSVVVSLLQYVDEQLITTAATPAIVAGGGGSGSKTVAGTGKNAKQVAQAEYGSAGFWHEILKANPWMPDDPRAPIPVGTSFVVPPKQQKTGSFEKTINKAIKSGTPLR